ncbi:MAG: hypothetical protein M1837_001927 [Sclerophora amabilis]|nr:MAG: hypothetical protein M1837_001927 [Sclerophora amabilis]
MTDLPTSIRVAQALGITTSAFISGLTFANSYQSIPPTLQSPAPLLLRQWRYQFNFGVRTVPPLVLAVFAQMSYVAYYYYHLDDPSEAVKWTYFMAAGIATFSNIPFTFAFIMPTTKSIAKQEEIMASGVKNGVTDIGRGNGSPHDLVARWGKLSAVRGWLELTGAVIGFYALLS